jgi:uncharacterized protein GlcG (DUF336 family)
MGDVKEQIPSAWVEGKLSYGAGLTLATAKKMLDAAEEEARERCVPMSMAIVDAGGNLLAFRRMDNAALFAIQISMDKAYTAVFGKLPTQTWCNIYQSGSLPTLFFHERWTAFSGGFPIIRDGILLGGIGASGGVAHEDTCVARAALLAGGFSSEDVDAAMREIET